MTMNAIRRFLRKMLRVCLWAYRIAAYVFLALLLLWSVNGVPRIIDYYTASVTLPNGMIIKRQVSFPLKVRDDLFAANGWTRLARDIEFVCFNDRWVKADGGIYDGLTGEVVGDAHHDPARHEAALDESRLSKPGITCNGYYTGALGASLLYDVNEWPVLPPCDWRNTANKSLRNRTWFDRPCF
jgi:hypothetical protein